MMKYIDPLLVKIKDKPQEVFVGIGVFCVVVMGTSVNHVASTFFALLLIASFFIIKDWRNIWKQLSRNEKLLMGSLALYALSGVVAYINVQDTYEYVKDLERYLRFAFAIPLYLYIKKYRMKLVNYLYVGAVVSGPFLFFVAFSAYLDNPNAPSKGYYHHIIFGSVAMLNVGVMLAILLAGKINKLKKIIIAISMLCGLVAVVLSQSRGVWLALPLYILLAMYYSLKHSRVQFGGIIIALVLMTTALLLSPISDMVKKRIDVAVNEVSDFYAKDQYISSLGTRLAMWEIAVDVWKQHPVIGTGPGDFDDEVRKLQNEGKYTGMRLYRSTHNIYVESLAYAGSVGLVTMLLAIFLMPLKIIMQSRAEQPLKSLVGFVFILLFATIGLSGSWTMRLSTVSVYITFLLVIISNMHIPENKGSDDL